MKTLLPFCVIGMHLGGYSIQDCANIQANWLAYGCKFTKYAVLALGALTADESLAATPLEPLAGFATGGHSPFSLATRSLSASARSCQKAKH